MARFLIRGIIRQSQNFYVEAEDEIGAEEIAENTADFDFSSTYDFEIMEVSEVVDNKDQ